MSDKVRENRIRRMAERQGLQLVKSRRRDPNAVDFGCFGLSDVDTNVAIMGFENGRISADLEQVEYWLSTPADRK